MIDVGAGKLCLFSLAESRLFGARVAATLATHGLFVGEAARVFAAADIEHLIITDTVPPFRLDAELVQRKITVLDTACGIHA